MTITREDAIKIAYDRAAERGWAIREPIEVSDRQTWSGKVVSYMVVSDPLMRGTKTRFKIDAETGAILEEGYIPR